MIELKTEVRRRPARFGSCLLILEFWLVVASALATGPAVVQDVQNKQVTLSDAAGDLVLRLNYDGRCLLDRVIVRGREVVSGDAGVYSAIKIDGRWFGTRADIPTPQVNAGSNSVTVTGIRFGGGGMKVSETWRFRVSGEQIVWRIDRVYLSAGTIEDTCFPGWDFRDMSTWTGALLGDGGVAWPKLFDSPNASYGVHNGRADFWNQARPDCLRTTATSATGAKIAVRFSRQPAGTFSFNYSITEKELVPKHGRSRFRRQSQDLWQPFTVGPGRVSAEFVLSAPNYKEAFDRGVFKGVDGDAVGEICRTIARVGVVDELIMGSNSYYSDVAVLHEPWVAQLGLAIDDPGYDHNLAETLDFQRRHAIGLDGRVKPRWSGQPGDEQRGTYDALGYYECQWGRLMDSQPSWVINVAELFDFTGDQAWLRAQKTACERVLDYLLRRDSDGDGLVEMMTDSHEEAKGSDWIDVVWAAHENALVNAQMYWAMTQWAGLEELLGDAAQARRYRQAAAQLKRRFNQTTVEGGFWDSQHQCYAYWRDRDGSVHGTNLVVPVNFSALAYGLCDEPARRTALLDRIEALMEKERLFCWPLCFFPYAPGEANASQYPFPTYENGDIFLAWGELGTRAYAPHNPAIALSYVKQVLARYGKDGLAFQRYLRQSQTGAGNDILANNCSIVVGLYRNLYGLQPKYNRLYLEPHLTPDLDGTQLKYWLRGRQYRIRLSRDDYAVSVDGFTARDRKPFAVNVAGHRLEYFHGLSPKCAMAIAVSGAASFELSIRSWPDSAAAERVWSETCLNPGAFAQHVLAGLAPGASYRLSREGALMQLLRSDASGRLRFECGYSKSAPQTFELKPRLARHER
ncbi:MAG: alpha-L-rhamnosidase-related protein [Limisphaerales bacterium]